MIHEYGFFNMMAPDMQNELIRFLFPEFIHDFQVFFKGCNSIFINRIIVSLQYKSFEHNQLIQSGHAYCHDIFFIRDGSVVVFEPTCYGETILTYEKGTVLNVYQVMLDV